jgi:hypothetical protein
VVVVCVAGAVVAGDVVAGLVAGAVVGEVAAGEVDAELLADGAGAGGLMLVSVDFTNPFLVDRPFGAKSSFCPLSSEAAWRPWA